MSTHSVFSTVRRLLAPVALAATFLGTLGSASIASAEERVAVGVRGPGVRVEGPAVRFGERPVYNPYWNAGGYYPGYVGPSWGGGIGYRGWGGGPGFRGGWRGGEYRGGGATFHGAPRGGTFHGGGAVHGGGGAVHGGGGHGGHR